MMLRISTADSVLRERPARVVFDIPRNGGMEKSELPFVIGVIADLEGNSVSGSWVSQHREAIELNRSQFDALVDTIRPRVMVRLPRTELTTSIGEELTLTMRCMADFEPSAIAKQIVLQASLGANAPASDSPNATQIGYVQNPPVPLARSTIETRHNVEAPVTIDARFYPIVTAVLHDPAFLRLEGAWRGLQHLVMGAPSDEIIAIDVYPTSRSVLEEDLLASPSFEQSRLWRWAYEDRMRNADSPLLAAIVCDFEFDHSPRDVALLTRLSEIGAHAAAPILAGASPAFFGMTAFSEFAMCDRVGSRIARDSNAYAGWNALRDAKTSNFLSLTLPRFLARHVYGTQGVTKKADGLDDFEEFPHSDDRPIDDLDQSKLCWSTAAYLAALNIVRSFHRFGMGAAIRGEMNGGLSDPLPSFVYHAKRGEPIMVGPAEVQNGVRADCELSGLGFLSMVQLDQQDRCVFYGAQTVQRPKKFTELDRTSDAQFCARLPYVLATGRLLHCLARYAQAMVGGSRSPRQVEAELTEWAVGQFVSISATTQDGMRKRPFAEIRAILKEPTQSDGPFELTVAMRPYLGLEFLSSSVEMSLSIVPIHLQPIASETGGGVDAP